MVRVVVFILIVLGTFQPVSAKGWPISPPVEKPPELVSEMFIELSLLSNPITYPYVGAVRK